MGDRGGERDRVLRPMKTAVLTADTCMDEMEQTMQVREHAKSRYRPRGDATEVAADHRVDTADLERELDDILDEVDAVLEENAEEFVKGFVQKGGE